MTYVCEIKDQPAQPTISLRTHAAVGDLRQVLGRTFGAIMQYLGEAGEQPVGAPFVAYYNMDMQNLDIEIGFPVAHPLPGRGDLILLCHLANSTCSIRSELSRPLVPLCINRI